MVINSKVIALEEKCKIICTFFFSQKRNVSTYLKNSSLFDEFVCKLGLFWHAWAILKRE
jgi:hypothetical protein